MKSNQAGSERMPVAAAWGLALVVLFFSGCINQEPGFDGEESVNPQAEPTQGNTVEDGTTKDRPDPTRGGDSPQPEGEAHIEVRKGEGYITAGFGLPLLPTYPKWAEIMVTSAVSWSVKTNVTALVIELAWDPGPQGQDLTLGIYAPGGQAYYVDEGTPGAPDSPSRIIIHDPKPGHWEAEGFSNGPVADAEYTIYASAFYGLDPPTEYTAVV